MEEEIKEEIIWEYENIKITKQLNNLEYGNGYGLYLNGKCIGYWDKLESLFEHDN